MFKFYCISSPDILKKVLTGFSIVRTRALGADVCNSARAMMFALGCIQALKCNTNKCPTGITTQDRELMNGIVVPDKAERVYQFHAKTVLTACEISGALGLESPAMIRGCDIMRREGQHVRTFDELYPHLTVPPGALLDKSAGPEFVRLQTAWDLDDGIVQHSYVA
mmetsp:Transcript_108490/g.315510  ORF Transcript_108490/g.315510 Transcript_108490/m.315510 type:complete len:166 (-) Transcript_108490:327-824(-)